MPHGRMEGRGYLRRGMIYGINPCTSYMEWSSPGDRINQEVVIGLIGPVSGNFGQIRAGLKQ
jgi:hypothetical protein